MKISILVLLSVIMMKGCDDETAKQIDASMIQYTATTRGFYRVITVENGLVKINKERHDREIPETQKLTDAQKSNIVEAFNEIDLDGMANLKAPSEKRFYDGAAIATLKIVHNGKTYESQPFDHMNPPAGIVKLTNILAEYTKDKE